MYPPEGPLPALASMRRRRWLQHGVAAGLWPAAFAVPPAHATTIRPGTALQFPRDHGAHLANRLEWWYATGWLRAGDGGLWGFQVTFFRAATGLNGRTGSGSEGTHQTLTEGRLVPRQLLLAHAAVTDITGQQHRHADRMARWSGQEDDKLRAKASTRDADITLHDWTFARKGPPQSSQYFTRCSTRTLALTLELNCTQPLLLQGDQGFSRKGPEERQASFYTSETQLHAAGSLRLDERRIEGQGRAWIDHEWSDELLHPQAVGWDWIGMNLDDGSALTAFQLRRADGSALWAGGSWRTPDGQTRRFAAQELQFRPLRHWTSSASGAHYPTHWLVRTPLGAWEVSALLANQELDSRNTTGTTYWEGLAELLSANGRRTGLGYLEMTGYAGRLSL